MMINKLLILSLLILLFSSCKKNNEVLTPPLQVGAEDIVALVANEGPFAGGTGTISLINLSASSVQNEVFEQVNGFPLGNIVQSIHVHQDRAYIVVNNASKVEVVHYPSFESIATIEGLISPRFCTVFNNRLYVTDWGLGGVFVVDLNTFQITNQIITGNGPERLLAVGDNLFISNAGNWSASDNRVSVIDLNSNILTHQIQVADNPNSMVKDVDNQLRVLCGGVNDWLDPDNNTSGAVATISLENLVVQTIMSFNDTNSHPSNLQIDASGTKMYYLLNGSAYQIDFNSVELGTEPLVQGNFYGIGFHPTISTLLLCDAADYVESGIVYTYTETGMPIDTFYVGVIPGNVFTK